MFGVAGPPLFLLIGFVLLMFGAETMVRGSVSLARRWGVPPLIVGLSVVAVGTSLPELIVAVRAAIGGVPEIAVGNVVGSNIANILLILGAASAIYPIISRPRTLARDGLAVLGVSLVFSLCAWWLGALPLIVGAVFVAAQTGYLIYCYWSEKNSADAYHVTEVEEIEAMPGPTGRLLVITAMALIAVLVGSELLVNGATRFARSLGVPEEVIGLTLVAFGTSVPELATAVMAAMRKHPDVAFGNVLGSNLFNLLGVAGITALVTPLEFPQRVLTIDLWVMLGATVALFPLMLSGGRLSRLEGSAMLMVYFLYIGWLFISPGGLPAPAAGL